MNYNLKIKKVCRNNNNVSKGRLTRLHKINPKKQLKFLQKEKEIRLILSNMTDVNTHMNTQIQSHRHIIIYMDIKSFLLHYLTCTL